MKIIYYIAIGAALTGAGLFFINKSFDDNGCCTPFCQETGQEECTQGHGGSWISGSCDDVSMCEEGCCAPFCAQEKKEICNQKGGKWTAGSCERVDQCEEGCCLPFCESETKVKCPQNGGEWNEGSCDDYDQCVQGCCQPFCENTSKKICDDKAGDFQKGKTCGGYAANMQTADTRIVPDVGTATYDFRFKFNTCGDSIFSEWKGTIDWLWEFQSDWGNPVPTQKTYDVSFTPDGQGGFRIVLGEFVFNGMVTEDKMDINFYMEEFIGRVEASGTVIRSGAQNSGNKTI